ALDFAATPERGRDPRPEPVALAVLAEEHGNSAFARPAQVGAVDQQATVLAAPHRENETGDGRIGYYPEGVLQSGPSATPASRDLALQHDPDLAIEHSGQVGQGTHSAVGG